MDRPLRLLLLAVLLLSLPTVAAQETTVVPELRELEPCDAPEPILFATNEAGIENLAFDGRGSLFLTAFAAGLYQAFPNGTVRHVVSDDRPIPPTTALLDSPNSFMGVDVGPDGALYVSEGMSITFPVDARVLRFPVPGEATFEVYADGFAGANGLAVTPDGVTYLAHGFRNELWRITGPQEWTVWQTIPTVNGVIEHPDGLRLVLAQVGDPGILAIDLASGARETIFQFSAGPTAAGEPDVATGGPLMLKGIDDLAVLPDGRIVGAAHLRKQFLLGDPATGEACVLLDGARAEPTSARVAQGFGAWDGWVFLTDNSGDIHAVDLRPAAAGATNATTASGDGGTDRKDSPPAGAGAVAAAIAAVALVAARRRLGPR